MRTLHLGLRGMLVMLAATLAGCASWWGSSGPTLVSGQIQLAGPLPADWGQTAVVVQLIDRTTPSMPVTLAEQTLVRPRAFPVAFSLPVIDARRLPSDGVYVLQASVFDEKGERGRSQGEARWRLDTPEPFALIIAPLRR